VTEEEMVEVTAAARGEETAAAGVASRRVEAAESVGAA
jgi:hypothetical protein